MQVPMPPTGDQFVIDSGSTSAVVTEVGAGLRALTVGGRALVETFPGDIRPPRGMGAVLVPWPNRTRGGRWTHEGAEQQLALTEPGTGNAIHGLLRTVLYRPGERGEDAITLHAVVPMQPGWPVPLDTAIRYAVDDSADGGGITVTHTVRNVGTVPVPFGIGAHPYLRAGDAATDDCVLTVAGSTSLPLDGGLPAGPAVPVPPELDLRGGRRLADLDLDHAYGACTPADGDTHVRHRLAGPDGGVTELWAEPAFGYAQVFTPPTLVGRGRAVAVEPMTCPPDALNSGDGLITLAPGEVWTGRWGIRSVGGEAISGYNAEQPPPGPRNYLSLLVNRARMEGFIVLDVADRYGEAIPERAGWPREGRLHSHEDVVDGTVAAFPDVLLRLFRGENTGKPVLRIH